LDSANTSSEIGRYDILTAAPFMTLETSDGKTVISDSQNQKTVTADPFLLLNDILKRYKQHATPLPFAGGAVGYFAYDLGRYLETLPVQAEDAEQIPDMAVGIYDWAVVVDHKQKQSWLVSHGLAPQTHDIWPDLIKTLSSPAEKQAATFTITSPLTSNFDANSYKSAFEKIKNYITEGDCYQVNLAKRFEVNAEGDSWLAYQALRKQNSAPFSAYFDMGKVSVLSSSPERLLRVEGTQVETKPIKGTRPRDRHNPENDRILAESLQASLKDRAENLMIVDLLRNDIGKVCEPGSIKVPQPFALESFATVHHLVSTITGTLAQTESAVTLLRACFPGGSITGAPKLRAMEIIEELEPQRRGVYCGSIGYIGFDGNMDTNITIRTMVFSNNRLRFWAGGGIVADSDADEEYQEVHDKAAAMINLIQFLQ
jgi:para-aminobenzoate synthetase component 1